MAINAPRGTNDFYGSYMDELLELENYIRQLCADYGYNQIRTPMFERLELFQRGVGESTDIVSKEMYTFIDKSAKQREFALKPEGTAGVVRAYLERKMSAETQPTKLYYLTPAFRYEKPEAGRFRQFHQFGMELFGVEGPLADAEVISVAYELINRLQLKNVKLHLNSLGNRETRAKYNELLVNYLRKHEEHLCTDCKERINKNPLRVLDCKNDECRPIVDEAPLMIDFLSEEDKEHFDTVCELLTAMGIEYIIDPMIVRGLDYYTRTVFEFISEDIGSKGTICGGGRYDDLIEEIGGKPTPAVGFGAGIERLLLTIKNTRGELEKQPKIDLFVGYIGEKARNKTFELLASYRKEHIKAVTDLMAKSLKNQMKYADKISAKYSFIIGDDELEKEVVVIKNMITGEKSEIKWIDVPEYIKSK